MVFYRKYRPQTISELDLSDVRDKLSSLLSSKEIPHAFLFTGSRGLGKTSSARILAKAINCNNKKGIEPCNKCEICTSITEGSHIDIIEIDAASNRGVDEIRSLREKVKFSSSELEKKVYIIDEVHMLTNEAFNALLKTLEEPPGHVIFILATTEAHKIPQTILSRVFSVKFEKPTVEELTFSLKRIVKGESLDVDELILPKIVELSEGSFRDGAKIMEELSLNSGGKRIDSTIMEKVFKTGSTNSLSEKLLAAIYSKEMKDGLKIINDMSSEGMNFQIIIEQMVEKLREDLISGKSKLEVKDLKIILALLNEAYTGIKFAVVTQLPLELALIEWSISSDEEKKGKVTEESEPKVDRDQKKDIVKKDSESEIKATTHTQPPTDNLLKNLIEEVHKEDKRVAAFLRSCKSAEVDGEILILKTPYSLHADKLSKPDYREIILKCVFDLDQNIKELKVLVS